MDPTASLGAGELILVDTDILVIAARYPRDERSVANSKLLEHIRSRPGQFGISVFSKLEALGALSFGMNAVQFDRFFQEFERRFGMRVVHPLGLDALHQVLEAAVTVMRRRLAFGDVLILLTAEADSRIDTFVTWNPRHFVGKTTLRVLTPEELLVAMHGG